MFLKQSTTVTVQVGPFLDATDGVTPEVALTPGIELSKAGGTFASRNSATAVAHDAEGFYKVELDTTDTATLGILKLKAIDSANHVPVWETYVVVPAEVYDTLVAGTDKLTVDLNMALALPGTPTADTVGDALKQATEQAPKKNVALSDIPVYMVDSTDHVTPETGLTITAEVSLDGAAFAAATGTVAEVGNGLYAFDASAADMNGSSVTLKFTAIGADAYLIGIKTAA